MAEEKKPRPQTGQSDRKTVEDIVEMLAIFILLGAVATALFNSVDRLGLGAVDGIWDRWADYFLAEIWPMWKFIAAILSLILAAGIFNNVSKLRVINIEEQKIYSPNPVGVMPDEEDIPESKNKKWEKIVEYSNSDSSSDWKLAIMEADVMLEELLRTLGYEGVSVGEILKSVDKNEFSTIESAWEAHKVRNAVAHSGGDFELNERETKRVIALFERVFEEFGII